MNERNKSDYNLGIILGLFLPLIGLLIVFLLVDNQDIKDGATKGFLIGLGISVGLMVLMFIFATIAMNSYSLIVPFLL